MLKPDPIHQQFVQALQHEPVSCAKSGCPGRVEMKDLSQVRDRIKTFELKCDTCGWQDRLTGREQLTPPWDEEDVSDMAYEHMMHQPALCPLDGTPVVFTSLPNPRRKARYRLSCFYCGRQAELDWPPPEARQ